MGGIDMTQEDKELLLKDLCSRLPYGLKVKSEHYSFPVTILYSGNIDDIKFKETGGIENICTIKPYLFPLSSMTKGQKYEYQYITERWMYDPAYSISDSTDWLNKNHFDYRDLIEKGLAIDATGTDIYDVPEE